MQLILVTAPIIECLSLSELKSHLVLDSGGTMADDISLIQSIAGGSHSVTTAYTIIGTAVEVIGTQSVVYLQPVNNGTSATVDCKIQDSDDNTTWVDWVSGSFAQVTESNDTVVQEKQYTGVKRYIRAVAKVLLAACEFGVSVVVNSAITADDANLTDLIQDAREEVEKITRRALLTQTHDYVIDEFPHANCFLNQSAIES